MISHYKFLIVWIFLELCLLDSHFISQQFRGDWVKKKYMLNGRILGERQFCPKRHTLAMTSLPLYLKMFDTMSLFIILSRRRRSNEPHPFFLLVLAEWKKRPFWSVLVLQGTIGYYMLIEITTDYYRLLQVFFSLLHVTLGYYRLLNIKKGYYRLL